MFSDFKVHVLGVTDNEKLSQSDAGTGQTYAFRTPSLRNLRYTDPYMHSGNCKPERVLNSTKYVHCRPLNPHVKPEQLTLGRRMNVNFKDIRRLQNF
jgi:cytochrome c peroxidase